MPMFNGRAGLAPGHFFDAVAQAADHRPARAAAPTVEQVVERVLDRFDADDDRSVTLTEVLAVADPDGTDSEAAADATEAVAAIDSDADAALSTTELSAAATAADTDGDGLLERSERDDGAGADALAQLLHAGHGRADDDGTHGEPAPPTVDEVVERVFDRLDADASDSLSLQEVLEVVDPDGDDTEAATTATEAFETIDRNDDASLSMAEVTADVAAADADADGLISRDERADSSVGALVRGAQGGPGRPGGEGPGGARGPLTVADAVDHVVTRFDDNGDEVIALTELLAVLDPAGTRTTLQDKLDDLFAAIDSDSSGGLSLAELSAAFTAMDSDGDGLLTHADHEASAAGDIALIGILLHPPGHGHGA